MDKKNEVKVDKKIAPEKHFFLKRFLPHSFVKHFVTNIVLTIVSIGLIVVCIMLYDHLAYVQKMFSNNEQIRTYVDDSIKGMSHQITEKFKGLEASIEALRQQPADQITVDQSGVENLQKKLSSVADAQKILQMKITFDLLKQQVRTGQPYKEEWLALKLLLQETGMDSALGTVLEQTMEIGLKKPEIKAQVAPHKQPTLATGTHRSLTEDWTSWLRSLIRIEKIGSESGELNHVKERNVQENPEKILQRTHELLAEGDFVGAIQYVESQSTINLTGTGLEDWLEEVHQYRGVVADLDRTGAEIKKKFLKSEIAPESNLKKGV